MADKSVLIVGAGAGLGASLGRCFAGAGYNIAVAARRPERLEGLITELLGPPSIPTPCVGGCRFTPL